MKLAFLGLILAFALAHAQPGWEVSGSVTTESGPVKDVRVVLSSGPSAVTDGQGHYALKGTEPGRYTLSVSRREDICAPQPRTLTVAAGMRLSVDFRIPKGGVISGRVLDRDKQPIEGVIVKAHAKTIHDGVLRLTEQGGDRTNDLGEYRIPYLPEGAYIIAVSSAPRPIKKRSTTPAKPGSGFPPVTFHPGVRVPDAAAVIEIRPGDERPGVDVTLQKAITQCVSFKVGSGFGEGNIAAGLDERFDAFSAAFAQGSLKSNGSYEACGLPPGDYRLHLTNLTKTDKPNPPGELFRNFKLLGYAMAAASVNKESVDLGVIEPLTQQDVPGTVIVKDTGSEDSVPPGILIRSAGLDLRWPFSETQPAAVQSDGNFVLRQVYAGEYGVRVGNLPAGYYLISASQQGRSILQRGFLPGAGDLRIEVGADGSTVSGRVLAEDGAAIPDASVFLVSKDSARVLSAQSDQTGAFQFAVGVPPGEYLLAASNNLSSWQRQDEAIVTRLAANGTQLTMSSHESRTVDVKLRPLSQTP
jgi:hypothetical protein